MASKFLRRSGVSVGLEADRIGWIPDYVIQVGIGFFHEGMHVLKEEWPSTEFLGFEAHPDIAKKVKDFPGEIRHCIIGDTCKEEVLYSKPRHKDGSSVFPFKKDIIAKKIKGIRTSTLDMEIGSIEGRKVLLWLDCEGSELRALRGAERILKTVKMVNVEMTPRPPSDCWPSPGEIHNALMDAGFYRLWLHTMRGGQYDAIYVKEDIFQKQYCCCPYTVAQYEEDHK